MQYKCVDTFTVKASDMPIQVHNAIWNYLGIERDRVCSIGILDIASLRILEYVISQESRKSRELSKPFLYSREIIYSKRHINDEAKLYRTVRN